MKKETQTNYVYRKSENLSDWIKQFEDNFLKSSNINDNIKEYVEYSMKECSEERKDFHDNYLYNLDNNLNVLSSKKNYHYLDFFKCPDPCVPYEKEIFKEGSKIKY